MSQKELMQEKGFIAAADAARILGRHISSVHRMFQTGKVEGMRVGIYLYIKKNSLVSYLTPQGAQELGLVMEDIAHDDEDDKT